MLNAGHLNAIILHLNVEGQSASKICIDTQLVTRHKALSSIYKRLIAQMDIS